MNHPTRLFIREHIQDDVRKLALQGKKFPDVDIPFAISQIAACQKVKDKIPEFYKPGDLLYPPGLSVEQSSSQLTAKYKSDLISGKTLVDLTGGFGIDFYFLSKKFENSIYVERQENLCQIAAHNFAVLGMQNYRIINADAESIIEELPDADWMYIDPHRRSETGKKVFKIADCEPDLTRIFTQLRQKSPNLLVKLSPMLDISSAMNELSDIAEVHVLSVENECKEIILKIKNSKEKSIQIVCENILRSTDNQRFMFSSEEEKSAVNKIAAKINKYLYEPNVSVLKAGAFKILTQKFPLEKLHLHTHLYTSDELLPSFPGKVFEVREIFHFDKKNLKRLVQDYPKANIASRNFILSVDDFRKKTGITDGGNIYMYLCKDSSDQHLILVCEKNKGF